MMMKPPPASSLEMSQPQFLFQFFVIAFNDPTLLGQADQVRDFRLHRQGRQPILGGFVFSLRPLKEKPLLGTRFSTLFIPMCRTDTEQSKPRAKCMFLAFSPGDVFPRLLRQPLRQRQDRDGLMIRVSSKALGRLASTAPGLLRQRSFPRLPDRGPRAHAENVEQVQVGDAFAKLGIVSIPRIAQ